MGKTRQTGTLVTDNLIFVDTQNKRIGIGTTQPSVKIHVTGDVNVSGMLTMQSGTALSADDAIAYAIALG